VCARALSALTGARKRERDASWPIVPRTRVEKKRAKIIEVIRVSCCCVLRFFKEHAAPGQKEKQQFAAGTKGEMHAEFLIPAPPNAN